MPPDLEERMRLLELRDAADAERDRHIDATLARLTATADRLEAAFNQGKGAVWVMGGVAAVSGAVSSFLTHLWISR